MSGIGDCRGASVAETYHNAGDALGNPFQRNRDNLKIRGRLQNTAIAPDNEEDRVYEPGNEKEVQQVLVERPDLPLLFAQELRKDIKTRRNS